MHVVDHDKAVSQGLIPHFRVWQPKLGIRKDLSRGLAAGSAMRSVHFEVRPRSLHRPGRHGSVCRRWGREAETRTDPGRNAERHFCRNLCEGWRTVIVTVERNYPTFDPTLAESMVAASYILFRGFDHDLKSRLTHRNMHIFVENIIIGDARNC